MFFVWVKYSNYLDCCIFIIIIWHILTIKSKFLTPFFDNVGENYCNTCFYSECQITWFPACFSLVFTGDRWTLIEKCKCQKINQINTCKLCIIHICWHIKDENVSTVTWVTFNKSFPAPHTHETVVCSKHSGPASSPFLTSQRKTAWRREAELQCVHTINVLY